MIGTMTPPTPVTVVLSSLHVPPSGRIEVNSMVYVEPRPVAPPTTKLILVAPVFQITLPVCRRSGRSLSAGVCFRPWSGSLRAPFPIRSKPYPRLAFPNKRQPGTTATRRRNQLELLTPLVFHHEESVRATSALKIPNNVGRGCDRNDRSHRMGVSGS
jgi:hypothetical protein